MVVINMKRSPAARLIRSASRTDATLRSQQRFPVSQGQAEFPTQLPVPVFMPPRRVYGFLDF
jgi:hypothetical protein